jgi:hypothetical protein
MAVNNAIYARRRRSSTAIMALCWVAAALGIGILLIILGTLLL